MALSGPIITLTSDFGQADWYVAAMKAVLLKECPDARLVDVTHQIPAGDILAGTLCLERAIAAFAPATIHLAVVDPGVGSSRRILVVSIADQLVLCPDNGLITWAWRRSPPGTAHELTWRPPRSSSTFHGRDVMAPAAGMLAAGAGLKPIARPIDDPLLLDVQPIRDVGQAGQIIHFDRFGNAITNILKEAIGARSETHVWIAGRDLGPIKNTYSDVAKGDALAMIGSSGLLEISVRDGSAKTNLDLTIGRMIQLR